MCLFVRLCAYLSVHLYVCLDVYLCAYLCVHVYVYLFRLIALADWLHVCACAYHPDVSCPKKPADEEWKTYGFMVPFVCAAMLIPVFFYCVLPRLLPMCLGKLPRDAVPLSAEDEAAWVDSIQVCVCVCVYVCMYVT